MSAAGEWDSAVTCVTPFWSDDSGYPVALVPGDTSCGDGTSGCQSDSGIEVHGRAADLSFPTWGTPVLLHEMGHLIGLVHSSDPTSVMYPRPTAAVLSVEDINRAQAILCGKG
jgi:hypothetical protein